MALVLIKAEWIVQPGGHLEEGPFFVTVSDATITGIHKDVRECQQQNADFKVNQEWLSTYLLTPGFIDLHTHGVGELRQRK